MASIGNFDFEFTQIDNGQHCRFSAYIPMDVARALRSTLERITSIKDVTARRITQVHEDVTETP